MKLNCIMPLRLNFIFYNNNIAFTTRCLLFQTSHSTDEQNKAPLNGTKPFGYLYSSRFAISAASAKPSTIPGNIIAVLYFTVINLIFLIKKKTLTLCDEVENLECKFGAKEEKKRKRPGRAKERRSGRATACEGKNKN